MSAIQGVRGQQYADRMYDFSGTITNGGTAQLVAPYSKERTSFLVENISDTDMLIEIGAARATATISSGVVNAVSVSNAGFGYSLPPTVKFVGGAYPGGITTALTLAIAGDPSYPSPQRPAKAHCVMTGSAPNMTVSSIAIDDPGSGYQYPPYVLLTNNMFDLWGAAVPSAAVGILLKSGGGSYTSNGTLTSSEQISIFCATTSKAFTYKFTI